MDFVYSTLIQVTPYAIVKKLLSCICITHLIHTSLDIITDYISDLVITGNFVVILYEAIVTSVNLSNGGEGHTGHSLRRLNVSWHSIMFTVSKYNGVSCILV